MGKKTKIRAKQQKYGRKYASHPYARALAERTERSKYIETIEEAIESKSLKVEVEKESNSEPVLSAPEPEIKEPATPAETVEKVEVVEKPKSRPSKPVEELKVDLDKPNSEKPTRKRAPVKKKAPAKPKRSTAAKPTRTRRKKTSEE